MIQQIIVGLMVSGIGFALIFYAGTLIEMFGRIPWAESNLGGTRQAYILSGFLVMVFGFLILFGVVNINQQPLV